MEEMKILIIVVAVASAVSLAFGILHPAHACSIAGGALNPCHA